MSIELILLESIGFLWIIEEGQIAVNRDSRKHMREKSSLFDQQRRGWSKCEYEMEEKKTRRMFNAYSLSYILSWQYL